MLNTQLFARINYVASRNLALVHEVVDLLQLRQTDNLERCLDEAAAVEVECLRGIFAIADVRALDGDHLDDRLEHRGAKVGAGWETDADDGTSWADVLWIS